MKKLRDKAYDVIKNKIVTCHFLPNTFINEVSLCEEIGVSRTPIREAMNKLEQEGLIKVYPKRGALVTDISLSMINEIFQVRMLLEPHIILSCARNIDKDKFANVKERLLDDLKLFDMESIYLTDMDIHNLILKSSDNRYFISLMESIFDQNHRLRIIAGQRVQKRLETTNVEHLRIIDALLLGNWQDAANAMHVHLENSKQAAFDGLMTNST